MKNKTQKHTTCKPTKQTNTEKNKKTLNFRCPQPLMMPNHLVVCHFLFFIHGNLGFPHSTHHNKNLTKFQCYTRSIVDVHKSMDSKHTLLNYFSKLCVSFYSINMSDYSSLWSISFM
jgi:hypothetical protein